MARILVTGMSGAGKSTLLAELARRGRRTLDTDHDGWTLADSVWDEPRMTRLLDAEPDIVVSGTVENQGAFRDRFTHVVLLSAPIDVLLERVTARTDNPYGSTPEDRADIRRYTAEVEPLLRRTADLELDGRRPVTDLADELEALLDAPHPPARRVSAAPGTVPARGGIHHVELQVLDLDAALASVGWILSELGYTEDARWADGVSLRLGDAYIVIARAPRDTPHDRRGAGVNHLAFHAGTRADVARLWEEAPDHGWSRLYADRHPHAGGPDHHAAFLEDAGRVKIELVASD